MLGMFGREWSKKGGRHRLSRLLWLEIAISHRLEFSERSSQLHVTNWLQLLGQTLKTAALFQGGYEQKPGASWSTILADHKRLDEGPIRMQHASRDIAECRPFTILYMDLTIDVPFCMDLTTVTKAGEQI